MPLGRYASAGYVISLWAVCMVARVSCAFAPAVMHQSSLFRGGLERSQRSTEKVPFYARVSGTSCYGVANDDNGDQLSNESRDEIEADDRISSWGSRMDGDGGVTTRMYGEGGLGDFDPERKIPLKREKVLVGDPQRKMVKEKEWSVSAILKELAAIQQQGPQKYCVLGTRHCSFLHQQIIELLAYALVLSGNHVYTSGAGGTHAATIRGALRAERPDLLTVVVPQSLNKQAKESQELLKDVTDLITMPQNDDMSLDVASRICNSYLLSQSDQLISFAFHESTTVIEATKEAKELDMLVTTLYLD